MIVVAVIGILAAIAYPSYRDFVRRGNRSDAKTVLMRAAQNLERRFTETNSYAGATVGAGAATDVWPSTTSPEGFYTLSLPTVTANTYTLRATASGTQVDDTACAVIELTQTGARTPAACW
jgi:type IV pilus assembly protein PilE